MTVAHAHPVTITGRFVRVDGTPATGWIELMLSTVGVIPADGVVVPPTLVTAALDADGAVSATVYATVSADWAASGLTYRVSERIDGAVARTYSIELPAGADGPVPLATLAPVVPGPVNNSYLLVSSLGAPGGIATLGSDGLLAASQRPAVDTSAVETPAGAQAKADAAQAASLQKSSNLSDVADVVAARSSLGLGGAAALNVGTTAATVAAGNDSRFSASGRVWRSGSRYAPQAINLGTGAPGQNEVRYIPVLIPNAVTLTEIAAEVTTAGSVGAVARLVIAAAGADGRPGSIVYCSAALPATATGKISAALAVTLAQGRHFFGLVSQGAPTTAPIFRTVTGVSEMYEQPALPLSYLRSCYSAYGQSGNVTGVGGITMDAADGARVEVLVG